MLLDFLPSSLMYAPCGLSDISITLKVVKLLNDLVKFVWPSSNLAAPAASSGLVATAKVIFSIINLVAFILASLAFNIISHKPFSFSFSILSSLLKSWFNIVSILAITPDPALYCLTSFTQDGDLTLLFLDFALNLSNCFLKGP